MFEILVNHVTVVMNISLFLQTLQSECLGKVTDFQAVPGCGLKCIVSNLESILQSLDMTSVNNRKNLIGSLRVKIDNVMHNTAIEEVFQMEGKLL
jgi:hypothetical protein